MVIFQILVVLFSVVIHEVSHGLMAYSLGDPTAKRLGRLTLNPLPHLDLFGSILLPMLTLALGGFIFGYAKPVPYNPLLLRDWACFQYCYCIDFWNDFKISSIVFTVNYITGFVCFYCFIEFGSGNI